jgi:hypothetical protein
MFPLRGGKESADTLGPFPVLGREALIQAVEPGPGVGINVQEWFRFFAKIIQAGNQNRVFKYIRLIPRVKTVTVAKHNFSHPDQIIFGKTREITGKNNLTILRS